MLRALLKRLRVLFRKAEVDGELDEEMRFHLEMEVRKNLADGMSSERARRQALLDFGGIERHMEDAREARGVRWLEGALSDARYAWRSIVRDPRLAIAAVLTLGLGIGGTTAVFGVVDALFLRAPAGIDEADQVRQIHIVRDQGNIQTDGGPGSYLDYRALRETAYGVDGVAAFLYSSSLDLGLGADAQRIRGRAVSWNYLGLLGVSPSNGRFFFPEEDEAVGAYPVAVISDVFRKRLFGTGAPVLGRTLILSGRQVTIVGVVEEGFTGIGAEEIDVWVPLAMAAPLGMVATMGADWRDVPGMFVVQFLARLRPDADLEAVEAASEMALRHAAAAAPGLDPTPNVVFSSLIPAQSLHRPQAATLALWLMAVAVIVLVIACANVANLLLARVTSRRREISLRLSLGATRWRLLRQHLAETLLLSCFGGGLGVLIAFWGAGVAQQFPLPAMSALSSVRLVLFAATLSAICGIVVCLIPWLRTCERAPQEALKESEIRPGRSGAQQTLLVVQVALSIVLLVGAGLLGRSFMRVSEIDPGLDLRRVLAATLDLSTSPYSDADQRLLYAQALERVEAMPVVQSAAISHFTPLGGSLMSIAFEVPGREVEYGGEGPYVNLVSEGYFETVGTAILEGRGFTDADGPGSEPVAVLSERMAELIVPDRSALGACIPLSGQIEGGGCTRVVGISENIRTRYLEEPTVPWIFLSRSRNPNAIPSWGGPTILVRTRGPADDAAAEVRSMIQTLRSDLPYVTVRPIVDLIHDEVLPYRLGAVLFGIFGALAMILAAVGLSGVLGYFVAQRTGEIGIRRSLGASRTSILVHVWSQGMGPVVLGVAIGIAAAYMGGRVLETLLYGISAHDVLTFVGVPSALLVIAATTAFLPASRAASVDPVVALRRE